MHVTLHRKGEVKSFEAILTMESKTTDRPDIIELLQYIRDNSGIGQPEVLKPILGESVPDVVVKGIIRHLKSIEMLYPNGLLSPKGTKVAETELVPVEERGQFIIFYIDDPILTNYILHYRRSGKGKAAGKTNYLDEHLYKNKTFRSVIDSKHFRIKQFDGISHLSYVSESSGSYRLYWDIDLDRTEVSKFFIKGELKDSAYQSHKFGNHNVERIGELDYKGILHLMIDANKKTGMNWNAVTECLEVPLDLLPLQDYEDLQTSLKVPEFEFRGKFDATEIFAIPIGPKNAQDAKKWLILLGKKFLEDGYKNSAELMNKLEEFKAHKAFLNYQHVIDSLTVEEILNELRNTNSHLSFWNLQTPMDLFMDVDARFIIHNRRIDIAPGKELSMMDIVEEITANEQPTALAFSSKYVNNPSQVGKFKLFVEAFKAKGVKDILLVTKGNSSIKDQNIQVESYDLYEGSIEPHDRYFAFRSRGIWHLFKMTAELDQCRYESLGQADEYTKGNWRDISIYEIKPEIFPEKLHERLKSMTEVYYV